jgi:hypothetical protein
LAWWQPPPILPSCTAQCPFAQTLEAPAQFAAERRARERRSFHCKIGDGQTCANTRSYDQQLHVVEATARSCANRISCRSSCHSALSCTACLTYLPSTSSISGISCPISSQSPSHSFSFGSKTTSEVLLDVRCSNLLQLRLHVQRKKLLAASDENRPVGVRRCLEDAVQSTVVRQKQSKEYSLQ